MDNSSENEKKSNVSGGMKGAFSCLCKHPTVFFAQAVDGIWLSTLGYSVEVSKSHKAKCKDCAKLAILGLLALGCVLGGIKGCSRQAKSSVQHTAAISSNQGR